MYHVFLSLSSLPSSLLSFLFRFSTDTTNQQFDLPKKAGTATHKPQKSGSLLGSIPFFGSVTRQNSVEGDVEGEKLLFNFSM